MKHPKYVNHVLHPQHTIPFNGDNDRELPWWMTRWVPQWLLNIMPQAIFERIVILGTIRGRSSGEAMTQLKIYLGHTGIALSLAALAMLFVPQEYAFWVAGIAGFVWWVVAEIFDTITFGWSIDMLYDGLEYAGGFAPFLSSPRSTHSASASLHSGAPAPRSSRGLWCGSGSCRTVQWLDSLTFSRSYNV